MNNLVIQVFVGSLTNLEELNFKSFGLKFYKLFTESTTNKLSRIQEGNNLTELFDEMYQAFWDRERVWLLIPTNLGPVKKEMYDYIFQILKLVNPSDICVHAEITVEITKKNKLRHASYFEFDFVPTGENIYDNYFIVDNSHKTEITEIKKYSDLYKERIKKLNYLQTSVLNYLVSYKSENKTLEFLSLCMSLESLISEGTEISYRLKRGISIILGENEYQCSLIFNNINKIYQLRSKAIHGQKIRPQEINNYLNYLRVLVSRAIIELTIHNVNEVQLLNKILTSKGFGDKQKISSRYKALKNLGLTNRLELIRVELQ